MTPHPATFALNAGLPMILIQVPAMVFLLVPVIAIEWLVVRRMLRLKGGRTFGVVSIVNTISTLCGVPLAWLAMLVIEVLTTGGAALGLHTPLRRMASVVLQAAWLVPYESDLYWMVPAAAGVLLVPTFFVSVFLERPLYYHFWRDEDRHSVSLATWRMNIASYAFLVLIAAAMLARMLTTEGAP